MLDELRAIVASLHALRLEIRSSAIAEKAARTSPEEWAEESRLWSDVRQLREKADAYGEVAKLKAALPPYTAVEEDS